jgi:hypothetical protein
MNQKKDTEISSTKQNVNAFRYLVKCAPTEKVQRELRARVGGNTNTFQGFRDIMEKYLLSVKAGTHFEEPGAHLELDSVVCLGLHVDLSMVNLSMMPVNNVTGWGHLQGRII